MKIQLWSVGKQHDQLYRSAIDEFTVRITNYARCEWKIIPPVKNSSNLNTEELKKQEGKVIFSKLQADDFLVLLDEKGKEINNEVLSQFIQKRAGESVKKIVFLIGGAFGVDDTITGRADFIWSLSKLVFPHMLVRLILAEQLYRSFTILQNEKYHHC